MTVPASASPRRPAAGNSNSTGKNDMTAQTSVHSDDDFDSLPHHTKLMIGAGNNLAEWSLTMYDHMRAVEARAMRFDAKDWDEEQLEDLARCIAATMRTLEHYTDARARFECLKSSCADDAP